VDINRHVSPSTDSGLIMNLTPTTRLVSHKATQGYLSNKLSTNEAKES